MTDTFPSGLTYMGGSGVWGPHSPLILIPAATPAYRMRSFGSRLMLKLGGETILERHLRILKGVFPEWDLTFVLGFGAGKVQRRLPEEVKSVLNDSFEYTGSSHSVYLGVSEVHRGVLLVEGDVIVRPEVFVGLDFSSSFCLYETVKHDGVGLLPLEGKVGHFCYGLPDRWLGITYLAQPELTLFKQVASEGNPKRLTYEILNGIIQRGGSFKAQEREGFLGEIDGLDDYKVTKKRASATN